MMGAKGGHMNVQECLKGREKIALRAETVDKIKAVKDLVDAAAEFKRRHKLDHSWIAPRLAELRAYFEVQGDIRFLNHLPLYKIVGSRVQMPKMITGGRTAFLPYFSLYGRECSDNMSMDDYGRDFLKDGHYLFASFVEGECDDVMAYTPESLMSEKTVSQLNMMGDRFPDRFDRLFQMIENSLFITFVYGKRGTVPDVYEGIFIDYEVKHESKFYLDIYE
jgi:hypothetical protein